jgi:hypothetical protein
VKRKDEIINDRRMNFNFIPSLSTRVPSSSIRESSEKVALRCSKIFFRPFYSSVHCKERQGATSFPKLALRAQTSDLCPFRFTESGYRKNLNPVVANIVRPPIGGFPKMEKDLQEKNAHFLSTTG